MFLSVMYSPMDRDLRRDDLVSSYTIVLPEPESRELRGGRALVGLDGHGGMLYGWCALAGSQFACCPLIEKRMHGSELFVRMWTCDFAWRAKLAAALLAVALAGCAGYGPGTLAAGASSAAVIERMGAPTGRHALDDGGTRLEFARGPYGLHTYMLDFDAADRLQRVEQVLSEANFYALRIGMGRDEVLRRIGRPSEVSYLSRQRHRLWSYRYETPFCIWFQVSLDEADRVAELGHNSDPLCDRRDFRQ